MILTSEVENILNGQIVRKENNDKAIGVSTANLQPNEKGVVPLSNQDAFTIVKNEEPKEVGTAVPAEPVVPAAPVTPEMQVDAAPAPVVESVPVAPVTPEVPVDTVPTPVVEPVAPVVPEVPPVETVPQEVVTPQTTEPQNIEPLVDTPNADVSTSSDEELESIEYDKKDDVISSSPIEVSNPAALESFNFNKNNNEILNDDVKEVKEEVVPEEIVTAPVVEMPQMPENILAQEPVEVNSDLFSLQVDNPITTAPPATSVDDQMVTPFVVPQGNASVESVVTASDINNQTLDNSSVSTDNPMVEQPLESIPVVEESETKESVPSLEDSTSEPLKEETEIPEGDSLFTESGEVKEDIPEMDSHEILNKILTEIQEIKELIKEKDIVKDNENEILKEDIIPGISDSLGPVVPETIQSEIPFISEPVIPETTQSEIPVMSEAAVPEVMENTTVPEAQNTFVPPVLNANEEKSMNVDDGVIRGGHFGL